MNEIVFHTEHKGERYRVVVEIDDAAIARYLGAKAVYNSTGRSRLHRFATAKAKKIKPETKGD
jgi:glutathione synthase/RimK-type ligase-like ATP-grasp enzyme